MNKCLNYVIKNRYKLFILVLFCMIITTAFKFSYNIDKIIYNSQYLTQYTYYYPSDATGSSNITASGKTIDDFTVDSNGWYHYNHNGKDYLVIAAALKKCRDRDDKCGINVSKHGIAKNITYYSMYDTLKLTIKGNNYDAIVLDACGACMWGRRDEIGQELFDVFVQNSSALNPSSTNNSDPNYTGHIDPTIEHFSTTYTGDITEGWIYKRFEFHEIYNKDIPEYKVEQNINDAIDEIFDRAKISYTSINDVAGNAGSSGGYNAKSCEEMKNITNYGDYRSWKQYGSAWSSLKLGTANDSNIGRIGCLMTSISIQLKSMNVNAGISNFNPGTFACHLLENRKFTSGGALYTNWNDSVPGVSVTGYNLVGSKTDKIARVQSLIDSGCKVVLRVKTGAEGQHWVAVTRTSSDNINIIDPGYSRSTTWPSYSVYGVSYAKCLKVG